jgi:NADH-quinone oxidoreductase subunit C
VTPDLAALAGALGAELSMDGFDPTFVVPRERYRDLCAALAEAGVWFSDVTAVDRVETVEIVTHLCASPTEQITVKTVLPDDDLTVDSLVPVYPGTEWLEREVYDMFGVRFNDHPNMKRVLMWDDFDGFPLRKSFPLEEEDPW